VASGSIVPKYQHECRNESIRGRLVQNSDFWILDNSVGIEVICRLPVVVAVPNVLPDHDTPIGEVGLVDLGVAEVGRVRVSQVTSISVSMLAANS